MPFDPNTERRIAFQDRLSSSDYEEPLRDDKAEGVLMFRRVEIPAGGEGVVAFYLNHPYTLFRYSVACVDQTKPFDYSWHEGGIREQSYLMETAVVGAQGQKTGSFPVVAPPQIHLRLKAPTIALTFLITVILQLTEN